jgi:hypothetical protein
VTNVQDYCYGLKGLQFGKAAVQQAKPLIAALFERSYRLVIAFLEVIHPLSSTQRLHVSERAFHRIGMK